jgi:hypothetical protein
MSAASPSRSLDELEATLAIERQLLESLLFKLTQAKLILASSEARFVGPALEEVTAVMQTIRGAEQKRAAAVAAVASEWGVPAQAVTLAYLAEHAPIPHKERFSSLRYELMDLTEDIERITRENERLATGNLSLIQGTLNALHHATAEGTAYTAAGRLPSTTNPIRFDQSI